MTPHEQIKQALNEVLLNYNDPCFSRRSQEDVMNDLVKALALLETHTLVPNEPTSAMLVAGSITIPQYEAMLKASKGA